MKNANISLNISDIPAKLASAVRAVGRYKVFLFFLLVASLYGFILWRVNGSSSVAPGTSDVSSSVPSQPRIDQATIDKIQNLQDNSVSVKSLFEETRQNPFQE